MGVKTLYVTKESVPMKLKSTFQVDFNIIKFQLYFQVESLKHILFGLE